MGEILAHQETTFQVSTIIGALPDIFTVENEDNEGRAYKFFWWAFIELMGCRLLNEI
jgi:hypothetical protein